MTLSKKVLIIICATLIIMHFVLFYLSKNILLQAFIKIEKDDTIINLKRSIYLINETVRHLDKITLDWSAWDDTYAFIKEVNKDYIASNLVDGTFIDLDLNLMAFFNNSHEIVYGTGFDIDYEEKIPIPESLIRHISNKPLLLNHQAPSSFKKGIIMLPEGPLLVSSRPIITSEDRGPIRGTLIIGRYFDNNEISKLSNAMHVELNLVRIDSLSKLPGINLELFKSSDFYIRPLNERFIEGYALVKDIYYKPAFLLKITAIRAIYMTGLENLNTIRTGLLIISILFTLFLILLLNKYVISRLTDLNFHVKTIIKTEDLSKRIAIKGKDELADLSYSFNEMLSTLENNQLSLRTSEERFKKLFESSPDVVFTISTDDKKILTLNPAFEKYTKWKPEEWIGKSIYEVLRVEDFPKVQERFSEVLEGKTTLPFELNIITKDNRFIIGEFIATPEIKGGEVTGIIGFARDITSRKQMENRIKVTAEQLENLSRRLINTQENERQRIAKELHDQLGQDLTVLKFNIRNTLSKIKENEINIRTRLEELILFIDNVIENIRKLAHDLMPSMIEDLGLKAALIKLIENFVEIGNYDYKINIDDIDDFIPTKNQILIYRIFQEILTNIAKHAQASYIEVAGFLQDSKVNFTITDNGIGIEMDRSIYEKDSTKGIGLSTIEARARIMKGDFIIRKLEDNGTYIKVSVPIEGVY